MGLDGGYIHNLVKELNSVAVDSRVDKVFQPTREEIVLHLRKKDFNKKLILCAKQTTTRIGFINEAPENPSMAPMFCMLLRKHIGGAKIREISQIGLERVVRIEFETRNEMGDMVTPFIYFEMITGSYNIVLVDEQARIIDSTRRSDIEKHTRIIQPGAAYTLPAPQDKINPLLLNAEEITAEIKKNKSVRICDAFLKTVDGVSPLVSRELALSLGKDSDEETGAVSEKQVHYAASRLKDALDNGIPYMISAADGTPKDFCYMPITQYGSGFTLKKFETFSELLCEFYRKKDANERIRTASQDVLKLLTNTSQRLVRKIAARKNDLKRCDDREKYRIYGELIKANIYRINRGDSEVKVQNYYSENGEEITIPLSSSITPAENAQKYFKEYKKLCVAERTLKDLIKKSEEELVYIDSVFDELSRAESSKDLSDIKDELAETGYIKRPKNYKKKNKPTKPEEYISSDGFKIYAGRNNIQNDNLTLHTAKKTDMWFHTKDVHGSHVIVVSDGRKITETAILQAAQIAAYNSKARHSSGVAVDYTLIKYVKKPSGAKYGMVIYTNNKTVYVTPKEEIANKLKNG